VDKKAQASTSSLNLWEEGQAGKIYGIAQKHLSLSEKKKALMELSEIVEFFPRTSIWEKACLDVFAIHLLNENERACADILARIQERASDKKVSLSRKLAHWDYHVQLLDMKGLIPWINKLNQSEKKSFRLDQSFISRFKKLIENPNVDFEQILKIWLALDAPKPFSQLLDLTQKAEINFSRQQMSTWLIWSLKNIPDATDEIFKIAENMGENGWGLEVQKAINEHGKKYLADKRWIRFLLKHQLFQEALKQIKVAASDDSQNKTSLTDDPYILETLEAHIGLQQWTESMNLATKEAQWIFSALNYKQSLKLFKGLHSQLHLKPSLQQLLTKAPKGLQKLIKVELDDNFDNKEEDLWDIFENDVLYATRSATLLKELFNHQRDSSKLQILLKKVKASLPNEKGLLSSIQQTINTLSTLKGEGSLKKPL
jgi:hypothetical protein